MHFPTTRVLDTFNRSNEGPPPSASWVTSFATGLSVQSNACGGSGGANWNTQFPAKQEVHATVATVSPSGNQTAIFARFQTANDPLSDHYAVYLSFVAGSNNDVLQLWKQVLEIYTQLGSDISLGADIATSDVPGLRTVESALDVFFNGVNVRSTTDSDIPGAGYIGLYSGETTGRWDDFGGGPFVAFPFRHPTIPALLAR